MTIGTHLRAGRSGSTRRTCQPRRLTATALARARGRIVAASELLLHLSWSYIGIYNEQRSGAIAKAGRLSSRLSTVSTTSPISQSPDSASYSRTARCQRACDGPQQSKPTRSGGRHPLATPAGGTELAPISTCVSRQGTQVVVQPVRAALTKSLYAGLRLAVAGDHDRHAELTGPGDYGPVDVGACDDELAAGADESLLARGWGS